MRIDNAIAVPAAQPVPTEYLRDAVRQSQAVITEGARQMAGMLAFFVTPKVRGVTIKLAKCGGESATLGTDTLTQDSKGEIPWLSRLLEAPSRATTAPITGIDLTVE